MYGTSSAVYQRIHEAVFHEPISAFALTAFMTDPVGSILAASEIAVGAVDLLINEFAKQKITDEIINLKSDFQKVCEEFNLIGTGLVNIVEKVCQSAVSGVENLFSSVVNFFEPKQSVNSQSPRIRVNMDILDDAAQQLRPANNAIDSAISVAYSMASLDSDNSMIYYGIAQRLSGVQSRIQNCANWLTSSSDQLHNCEYSVMKMFGNING